VAAVILGWSAGRRNPWNYREAVEQVRETGRLFVRWDINRRRNIGPGTEVWLFLHGSSDAGSGLIGHGAVLTEILEARHLDDPESAGQYAGLVFDALLPFGEQIRPDVLAAAVPGVRWGNVIRQPTSVPLPAEPGLRRLWRELGPAAATVNELVPGTYPVEAVSSIEVNRYERDPDARRICLAFHGTSCAACGFSFEARYGQLGEGFIHVHHTVPASLLGSGYQLDPVADLVPLCANCHDMAHRGASTARSVTELRNIIASAGHLRGEMVAEETLEAQENAVRILNAGLD
jgi:5-methylcytosine-specific restriction protein A